MVVHRPIIGLIAGLVLAGGPPAVAAGVLRVGVLDHSPPCAERVGPGRWDGKAVELWRQIAERQRLPYVLQGYPTPQSLLEASQSGAVDVGVGCLTISPERLGRYRFSLPFQSQALALSPALDPAVAARIDRAISEAKRDGQLPQGGDPYRAR